MRERPPYKPPQNVAYYKGPDAASIRLLQSDDPSNAEGSEGRGWHVGLCKALRGAVQELAIDLVVQEDSEVLVGSSRGASRSSTPRFPQAARKAGNGNGHGSWLIAGDLGW